VINLDESQGSRSQRAFVVLSQRPLGPFMAIKSLANTNEKIDLPEKESRGPQAPFLRGNKTVSFRECIGVCENNSPPSFFHKHLSQS